MELMLQHLRKKAGLKQGEMADRLGVNNRTYGSWERGEAMINLAQACACADILGCTVDEIAGRSWPPREIGQAAVAGDDPLKRQVVDAYDSMTQAGRESLAGVAKGLSALPENRPGDSRDRMASRDVA